MTLRPSSDSCFLNAKGVSDRHSQCWHRHPGAVGGGEAPRRCPFSQEHPLVHVFWYVLFFFFVLFFGLFVSLALWISPWIKKTNRSPMHTFFFFVVKDRDKRVCICRNVDSDKCTSWAESCRKARKCRLPLVLSSVFSGTSPSWSHARLFLVPSLLHPRSFFLLPKLTFDL